MVRKYYLRTETIESVRENSGIGRASNYRGYFFRIAIFVLLVFSTGSLGGVRGNPV